ncbi:MAG: MBL fold metallo-hydrolase [Clostridiales bacterium]|nr:MBL fold metallo-hydrolase [Candidatus Cacconaster stercorequi]
MFTVHTLSSGSEGNSTLFSADGTHLLIDAGISARRIKTALAQLGLGADDLAGILITHEHSDHICGLQTLLKHHRVPLYANAATARQITYRVAGAAPLLHNIESGQDCAIGTCRITAFATSHDTAASQDYRIDTVCGAAGILTDTGYVTDEARSALRGVNLLVLESNHDIEMLQEGPYPYPLKQRILSDFGHLSNDAAAAFAVEMAQCGTTEIVLAHLSKENNTPAQAEHTVQRALRAAGLSPRLGVAPRKELHRYQVEVSVCKR